MRFVVKWFVPIEREMGSTPTRPVEWYVLIREMEVFRRRTGMGLAYSWTLVHQENYEAARKSFDETKREYEAYERVSEGG